MMRCFGPAAGIKTPGFEEGLYGVELYVGGGKGERGVRVIKHQVSNTDYIALSCKREGGGVPVCGGPVRVTGCCCTYILSQYLFMNISSI